MAQQGIHLEKDLLCCPICLDPMKDPVTIPCGHSYCMRCIGNYWDEEEQRESHSCPQCRHTFSPRPVLVKNTLLADLVEGKKKSGVQATPADHGSVDPGDVSCDFCTERKLKAVKSCLQCLVSYCGQHLQSHYDVAALKKHKLVDPSKELLENICSRHNEVMKIFCRTDNTCICYLCSMDEHRGHDTVTAAAQVSHKQRELKADQGKVQQRILERTRDIKMLQHQVEAINQSADEAVRRCEEIFTEVSQQIRSRQKTELTYVCELQERLEGEMDELRRRNTELEQLSQTDDHIQFLHRCSLMSHQGEAANSSNISILPLSFTEDVETAVSEAKGKLQDTVSEEWPKTPLTVTEEDGLLPQAEPKTREEFFKYVCPITLDMTTASNHLRLSDLLEVECCYHARNALVHPDQFTDWCQILCREHLTGRCYWEVKLGDSEGFIAVAYKTISRKGHESAFGNNNKSWALQCFPDGYEFRHNNTRIPITGPQSQRIGVYLDHTAGILAFYSVSDTMTLLHRVQTTFTQPLCPGVGIHSHGDTAEFFCTPDDIEDDYNLKIQHTSDNTCLVASMHHAQIHNVTLASTEYI
ncbi:tripartite motif-containing protein 16-like [Melanotaenia boesemani]|uniref:tripartite motif-containing protein 16-like n=1 Tax=Melanotaenia boesemani TaxID=1250792 RepID=UPI001C040E44|nr:tripartite motif-containing protein 16-like [Melanotaenia boesemani]